MWLKSLLLKILLSFILDLVLINLFLVACHDTSQSPNAYNLFKRLSISLFHITYQYLKSAENKAVTSNKMIDKFLKFTPHATDSLQHPWITEHGKRSCSSQRRSVTVTVIKSEIHTNHKFFRIFFFGSDVYVII